MADVIADGTRLPFTEAVKFFEGKIANVKTTHWADVWKEAHTRGFMVAGAASEALVADFRAAVERAINEGTTLVQFRDEFDAIVKRHGWQHTGEAGWRAKIIYDTNLSMAYSAGQYEQLASLKDSYPYWRYVHGLHGSPQRPRPQHVAWSGLVLRADDPFWDTHFPPNGWRCTCGVEAVSREELDAAGREPDEAPELKTRPYRNPRTGVVTQEPEGIDPGFGYNPGKAWAENAARAEAGANGLVPVESLGAAPTGVPGSPPQRQPRQPGDRPLLPVPEWIDDQVRHIVPDHDAVQPDGSIKRVRGGTQADGTARVVGTLPEFVLSELPPSAPRTIVMTSERVGHVQRDAKGQQRLPMQDLRNIQAALSRPMAVLVDRRTPDNLIFLAKQLAPEPGDGRVVKIVVKVHGHAKLAGRRMSISNVLSAGLVDAQQFQRSEYEIQQGSLNAAHE